VESRSGKRGAAGTASPEGRRETEAQSQTEAQGQAEAEDTIKARPEGQGHSGEEEAQIELERLDDGLLGLESGAVRLAPYSDAWPGLFRREADRIRDALVPLPLRLEHMGSTAVPGLCAKPIIDIVAGYPAGATPRAYIERLVRAGYIHRGEQEIPGREFFRLGVLRTHHVNLVVEGGDFWRMHLVFRDRLRGNDAARDAYGTLKLALAARYPFDREAYIAGKAPFVAATLAAAERE
jgi:GrpB-like predicted nucleotidyltransferase (UPF0157 family)